MKCLRCEGTGNDPQCQIWDDPDFNLCVECGGSGDADFKLWIWQAWDLLIYKLFGDKYEGI